MSEYLNPKEFEAEDERFKFLFLMETVDYILQRKFGKEQVELVSHKKLLESPDLREVLDRKEEEGLQIREIVSEETEALIRWLLTTLIKARKVEELKQMCQENDLGWLSPEEYRQMENKALNALAELGDDNE